MRPLLTKRHLRFLVTAIIVSFVLFAIYFIYGIKNGTENCFTVDNNSNAIVKIILTTKSSIIDFSGDTVTKIIFPGQKKCIYHEETLYGELKNDSIKDLQKHFNSVLTYHNGTVINLLDKRLWTYKNGSNENLYTLTIDDLFTENKIN